MTHLATPESTFRVGGFDDASPGLHMRTGDWMLDEHGVPCTGALGVLLDDAVGRQVFLSRPSDTDVSVTSELAFDVVVAPPWPGPRLRTEAWVGSADAGGAFTQAQVLDGGGRLVAAVSNWGRYIAVPLPITPVRPESLGTEPDPRLRTTELLGAAATATADGAELTLDGAPRLANPMGIVHGGIMVCAAERAAARAVSTTGWWASSVRMHYLRPTPLVAGVRLAARVAHRTRTLAVVRVLGTRPDGLTCTDGTITFRKPA